MAAWVVALSNSHPNSEELPLKKRLSFCEVIPRALLNLVINEIILLWVGWLGLLALYLIG